MSVENKIEAGNTLPDVKNLLKNKDIEGALSGLGEVSKNTLEDKEQELAGCLEIAEFTCQLNETQTDGVQNILAQFLTPQSLQA